MIKLIYRSPSHIQNFCTHLRPRPWFAQRISLGWQLSASTDVKISTDEQTSIDLDVFVYSNRSVLEIDEKKHIECNYLFLMIIVFLTATRFITVITTIIFTIADMSTRNTSSITTCGFINTTSTADRWTWLIWTT